MNKSDLVREIANQTGMTQLETRTVIDNLVRVICAEVSADRSVNLRGFGTFKAVTRKPRKAQHPRTRSTINVPSKRVPVFRPSPEWKNELTRS